MNKIDQTLDCICFTRYRTKRETGIVSSSQKFGLVPIEANRDAVHIIRCNTMIEKINKKDSGAPNNSKLCDGLEVWKNGLLYEKMFLFNSVEQFDNYR